jgi:hypothetical protein
MPSVVQIQSPVAGNPVLQIEQIAANMQRMRNMGAQENLMRQQAQMAPQQMAMKKQAMEQAQALQNAQIAHLNQMTALGQTTPFQRNIAALSQYGSQPQGVSEQPGPTVPSPAALSGQEPQQEIPQQTASPGALGTPPQQMTSQPQTVESLYPGLNPAQMAYVSKKMGIPTNTQLMQQQAKQQFYQNRALQSMAGARGKLGQAMYLANAPDQYLQQMGISPGEMENFRRAQIQVGINSLPNNQKLQWTAGNDFINQFNTHLRGATLDFLKDLKSSGISGLGKLQGSKLMTVLGKDKTLYDKYQNLLRMWQTSVSDYRQGLGDSATNEQLKFVNSILKPQIGKMSIPGILKGYNNLLNHTDTQLKGVSQTSALQGFHHVMTRRSPQLFNPNAFVGSKEQYASMRGEDGSIHKVPLSRVDLFLSKNFKMVG